MPKICSITALLLILGCTVSFFAYAGDEDEAQAKAAKVKPQRVEEAPPSPKEAGPDFSLGTESSPEFKINSDVAPTPKVVKGKRRAKNLDSNLDYSEILGGIDAFSLGNGVMPPAQGFRGYRPCMIAISAGDRTPGFGGLIEFSWNRIGSGIYASARPILADDGSRTFQDFFGVYGLYRWLPFEVSPYILLGLEGAYNTPLSYGGTAGVGIEARIYYGWTILFGYTYHSAVSLGFLGGAVGWSF